MNWPVVCRVGQRDHFELDRSKDVNPLNVCFELAGDKTSMREHVKDELNKRHGRPPKAEALDFLYFSMAVYASDLLIPRSTTADGWMRSITLHFPVQNVALWKSAKGKLAETLSFLTGDEWSFRFRKAERQAERKPWGRRDPDDQADRVVLCSGGLDSLAGCIEFADRGEALALVGHYGGGLTVKFQKDVMHGLEKEFEGHVTANAFHVLPPNMEGDGELTMRSRSLLFIALGLATASVVGEDVPVSIPENGLITLNVPLTIPRNGSASTRTTHPYFISSLQECLSKLGIPNQLDLPYRFKTKGELLAVCNRRLLTRILQQTMSCSHPEQSRWEKKRPGLHCGYCVPCLIRRAAVHYANLEQSDAPYTHDVLDKDWKPTGKKKSDIRAMRMAVSRMKGQPELLDVFTVLDSGPLPPEDANAYAGVYRRGMKEVASFLGMSI